MTLKPENPPAFPQSEEVFEHSLGYSVRYEGMTLRDYFAAKALQGFCSNPNVEAGSLANTLKNVAADCYVAADLMLKERE